MRVRIAAARQHRVVRRGGSGHGYRHRHRLGGRHLCRGGHLAQRVPGGQPLPLHPTRNAHLPDRPQRRRYRFGHEQPRDLHPREGQHRGGEDEGAADGEVPLGLAGWSPLGKVDITTTPEAIRAYLFCFDGV